MQPAPDKPGFRIVPLKPIEQQLLLLAAAVIALGAASAGVIMVGEHAQEEFGSVLPMVHRMRWLALALVPGALFTMWALAGFKKPSLRTAIDTTNCYLAVAVLWFTLAFHTQWIGMSS